MTDESRDATVGSTRHTWTLMAILLGIALMGWIALQRATPNDTGAAETGAPLYLGLLAAEWGLFLYVRAGLRRHGRTVGELISARPLAPKAVAVDLLIGVLLLAALVGAELLLEKALGRGNATLVHRLQVSRLDLVPLWILLAVSAGFVEELTFRGYLQRQFGAWLMNPWWGVIVQAALFGITHGYQGGILMARIAVLGFLFGAAAVLRRSLVPGMIAHAGLDIIGGLARLA